MALSNIFREPRRELIEQLAGSVAVFGGVGAFLAADYGIVQFSGWTGQSGEPPLAVAMIFIALLMIVAGMLLFLLLLVAHAVGESICGAMAERGFDPRPKRRY